MGMGRVQKRPTHPAGDGMLSVMQQGVHLRRVGAYGAPNLETKGSPICRGSRTRNAFTFTTRREHHPQAVADLSNSLGDLEINGVAAVAVDWTRTPRRQVRKKNGGPAAGGDGRHRLTFESAGGELIRKGSIFHEATPDTNIPVRNQAPL